MSAEDIARLRQQGHLMRRIQAEPLAVDAVLRVVEEGGDVWLAVLELARRIDAAR